MERSKCLRSNKTLGLEEKPKNGGSPTATNLKRKKNVQWNQPPAEANIEEEEGELVRYCGPWTRPSVINFFSSLFANNNKKLIPVIKNKINH